MLFKKTPCIQPEYVVYLKDVGRLKVYVPISFLHKPNMMRYLILFLFTGLAITKVNSQNVCAGIAADSNCIKNIEPDTVLHAIANSPDQYLTYSIDCNRDGVTDFTIQVFSLLASHGMGQERWVRIVPSGMNKIAWSRIDTSEHPAGQSDILSYVAQRFMPGDTINHYPDFTGGDVYLAADSWYLGAYSIHISDWVNLEGYLGVYVAANDKFYWIKVNPVNAYTAVIMEFLNNCHASVPGYVQQEQPDQLVELFPNPCSDFVSVRIRVQNEPSTLILLDIHGHVIKAFPIQAGESLVKANLTGLVAGVYLFQVCGNFPERQFSRKVIVK